MDGQLWYDLYRRRWPLGIKLEAQLDHTKKTLKVRPLLINLSTHKFTHIHTHTHTHTHAHSHTYTHTHSHTYTTTLILTPCT